MKYFKLVLERGAYTQNIICIHNYRGRLHERFQPGVLVGRNVQLSSL